MAKDTTSASIDISFQPTKCLVQYIYIYFCVFPFHPLLFFSGFLFLLSFQIANAWIDMQFSGCDPVEPPSPRVTDQKNSVNHRCRPAMVHSIFIATISIYNIADGFYFCCVRSEAYMSILWTVYIHFGGEWLFGHRRGWGRGLFDTLVPFCHQFLHRARLCVYSQWCYIVSKRFDFSHPISRACPSTMLCHVASFSHHICFHREKFWLMRNRRSFGIDHYRKRIGHPLSFPFHPCFMSSLIKNYIEKRVP